MFCSAAVAAAFLALLAPAVAEAAPGDLDPTFGSGGVVTTDLFAGDDEATDVVVQPDGKIVVGGRTAFGGHTYFVLARYRTDGTLDPSFGIGGHVETVFNSLDDFLSQVLLQPDGKIIAVGEAGTAAGRDFGLVRYDTNGDLDPSFGVGGKVTTAFPLNTSQSANGAVVQPDGKIVVAGSLSGTGKIAVARYESSGALDATFGIGGLAQIDLVAGSENARRVALQPDGKIVIAGNRVTNQDFLTVRLEADGTPDGTFGVGGAVVTDFFASLGDIAFAIAVQPDGAIVVAGRGGGEAFSDGFDGAMVRYLGDGTPDPAFGANGRVLTNFSDQNANGHSGLLLQGDGRIVAVGFSYVDGSNAVSTIARFRGDGSPDLGFGAGGKVATDIDHAGFEAAEAVVATPDGKLVVVGHVKAANEDFFVARYDGRVIACSPTPAAGCKTTTEPHRAFLELRQSASGNGDKFVWRWKKGAATTLGDFGDPLATDHYLFCAYDESGMTPQLRFEALAAAGGLCNGAPCWRSVGGRRFEYRDGARTPLGLAKLVLTPGADGRATIGAKGLGVNLPPYGLSLSLPLRLQLRGPAGQCWEAVYSAGGVNRNDAKAFVGKGD